jgi:acetylornithine deacetylase/succinyl-diaminopimelate desuccinylase-like protein
MKGGVAMMLAAFLRARAEGQELPADVVLAIPSNDEAGGELGARFLIERHPEVFSGTQYALGEFGGSTLYVGKRRSYAIRVAEKQKCWTRAMVRGLGGHGSMPVRGGAISKLSRLLRQLNRPRLPVHVTPAARLMFETMASALGIPTGLILGQLVNPRLTNSVPRLLGERGRLLGPLLHSTVSPTVLYGSANVNAIPSEVSVELDGRLLPGYGPEDIVAELRSVIGGEVEPK